MGLSRPYKCLLAFAAALCWHMLEVKHLALVSAALGMRFNPLPSQMNPISSTCSFTQMSVEWNLISKIPHIVPTLRLFMV